MKCKMVIKSVASKYKKGESQNFLDPVLAKPES